MTGLLHFTIFLCGVAATAAVIGIYCYISNCIENYTSEKIKETLEEMKNCPEDSLGKTAMCTNDEDGKMYVFNINNNTKYFFR